MGRHLGTQWDATEDPAAEDVSEPDANEGRADAPPCSGAESLRQADTHLADTHLADTHIDPLVEAEDDAQETLLLVPLLPPGAGHQSHGQVYEQRPQRFVLRRAVPSQRTPASLLRRPLALALLACLCLLLVAGALDGMQQYALIRAQTLDAVAQIHAAQTLLDASQPSHPLDAATLHALDAELAAADHDAALLSGELGAPSGSVLLARMLPGLSARLASAAQLAGAADATCQAGRDLIAGSLLILQLRADGFLDAHGQLTHLGRAKPQAAALIQQIQVQIAQAAAQLDRAAARASSADLAVLPPSVVTSAQRPVVSALIAAEPSLHARLTAPDGWQLLARIVLGAAPVDSLLAG